MRALSPAIVPGSRPAEELSQRELDVLALVALGATNPEIAARLYIAESTVQTHVKHILRKLGVRNRTQAAVRYVDRETVTGPGRDLPALDHPGGRGRTDETPASGDPQGVFRHGQS